MDSFRARSKCYASGEKKTSSTICKSTGKKSKRSNIIKALEESSESSVSEDEAMDEQFVSNTVYTPRPSMMSIKFLLITYSRILPGSTDKYQ